MTTEFTRSLDTFQIEIKTINGRDYVEISRANLNGKTPMRLFPTGCEEPAFGFLSAVAELIGVQIVAVKTIPIEGNKC